MPNFPNPKYTTLITSDPQIVKVGMDEVGIGSRKSALARLGGDQKSNNPSKPSAPEMTIKHV